MKTRYKRFKAYSLQINLELGNIDKNIKKIESFIKDIESNSLLVLPEMFSSGFDNLNLEQHSKKSKSILDWLAKISIGKSLTIVGSLPEKYKGNIFNRAFIIDNGNIVYKQSKIKLFTPNNEDKYFSSGKVMKVIPTTKGNIGILICFELRFPELALKLRKKGVEIILVPAQWGKARKKHLETLSLARAIEEQAYLLVSDTVGKIGDLEMAGSSGIYSPWGDILDFEDNGERLLSATIDTKEIYKVRRAIKMY